MSDHIARAFDADLQELMRMVAEMGGQVERQIIEAVDAFVHRDPLKARQVVSLDASVDRLQREIEERCVLTIARRQPMAVDLREIVGALRIAADLERAGDLAKNIGKRVAEIEGDFRPQTLIRGIEHMAELVLRELKLVLDSYAGHDEQGALTVWHSDKEVDALCTSLFRELLTYMMEDPRNISFCLHLMFCAKNIERIGDHATNVAETIYYMIEGRPLVEERPKGSDVTAFSPAVAGE